MKFFHGFHTNISLLLANIKYDTLSFISSSLNKFNNSLRALEKDDGSDVSII